jgi:Uma2 family endonuclease
VSIAPGLAPPADSEEFSVPIESLKRFTVDEYHMLIDAGTFADNEALELLEGFLVYKMGKKRAHSLATRRLRQFLEPLVTGCYVDTQEPVTTGDSEPEPDASVVRGRAEDYGAHQPFAENVVLVVEVSDRTLGRDRGMKKRIYARANIPVYWIVNLVERQVEIYTEPISSGKEPDYKSFQIVAADGELPVIIDGRELGRLKVKDLLP